MLGQGKPAGASISLPGGETAMIPVDSVESNVYTKAAVIKDSGDDQDITSGVAIPVSLSWSDAKDIRFIAGKGVGTVTKPSLSVLPSEPTINPVPRRMITDAIRSLTDRGVEVTISIPCGEELDRRSFHLFRRAGINPVPD